MIPPTSPHSAAAAILTRDNGAPVGNNQHSRTAGPDGPVLLDDIHLIQKLQRFDRERIPERVVHARGTGAHGTFLAMVDLSSLTRAALFANPGRKTPVFVRFSSVIHGQHSPETLRDPRGFATKFYTSEGNWDLVGNNLPVFFIRDALKFPDMVHALKPSPHDNRQDPNRFFDFFSHVPESIHMLTFLYSDLGTPATYRHMDGNSVHAYKLVNAAGVVTYVKFRWVSLQGVRSFTAEEARHMQGEDFNVHTTDLYAAIQRGEFPSWELRIQTLSPEAFATLDYDPLDATKEWRGLPWKTIGRMTLDRLPDNFFQETEQSAFAPSNLVPGIEASEDRLLQGRLFSYADTHLHRVGPNHMQLPINRPIAHVRSFNQDGLGNHGHTVSRVNYQPSRSAENLTDTPALASSEKRLTGTTQQRATAPTLNFRQAGERYREFSESERARLVDNFAADLGKVQDPALRARIAAFAFRADRDYGTRLASKSNTDLQAVEAEAAQLLE